MDNLAQPIREWSPPRSVGIVFLCAAVILAVGVGWFRVIADPVGVILISAGALLVTYFGVTVLALRPRLSADSSGVTYRSTFGRRHFPWDGLEIKRTTTKHWGRESILLELTRGDAMLFLGRWELGESATLVGQQLEALRP